MRKILEECPSCGGELVVTELSCAVCETVVRGRYRTSFFDRLSEEDLAFLELFVRARGNVKEMERELGLSYWAIRNRLNELVDNLEEEPSPEAPAAPAGADALRQQRREILERLQGGELTVAEASALLSTQQL